MFNGNVDAQSSPFTHDETKSIIVQRARLNIRKAGFFPGWEEKKGRKKAKKRIPAYGKPNSRRPQFTSHASARFVVAIFARLITLIGKSTVGVDAHVSTVWYKKKAAC